MHVEGSILSLVGVIQVTLSKCRILTSIYSGKQYATCSEHILVKRLKVVKEFYDTEVRYVDFINILLVVCKRLYEF